MKAIITGSAGFIGCHMARRLMDEGWHVVGVDNLSRRGSTINLDWLQNGKGNFLFEYGDIRNSDDVNRIFKSHKDTKLVFHSAAQVAVTTSVTDPRLDFDVNALGTFNVLEAVRKYSPEAFVIFPSTNKVYGCMESARVEEVNGRYTFADLPNGVSESQNLDFHSPYGCSKGVADQYIRDYVRIYGLKTVVCRQSCIYGTRQFGVEDQGWIAWFLIAALCKSPVVVYGDGKQVRDVLWMDDLIDLFLTMFKSADTTSGRIFNVGGGPDNTLSLNELIESVPKLTGNELTMSHSDWRPGDQKVYVSDISAAGKEFGWKPKVGVEEGLKKLSGWLKENIEDIHKALKVKV